MRPVAIAAQGRWKLAQPSGTTSWITPVITSKPSALSRVAKPITRKIGSTISPTPSNHANSPGAGRS